MVVGQDPPVITAVVVQVEAVEVGQVGGQEVPWQHVSVVLPVMVPT